MKQLDFVAIGDIVTDAFIELEDAWIETDNAEASKELCMRFGDKIPYRKVDVVRAVGNGPNAAVAAKRLGLETAVITDVGDDQEGAGCIAQLREEGVSEEFVQIHAGMYTNYHFVLRLGAERTILVKHETYPYGLPEIAERSPKWIYLTSLSDNSLEYHMQIAEFLEKNPNTKLAFQPGTFQMKLGIDTLARIYAESDIFFCNKEEAQRILSSKSKDVKVLAQKIMEHGPKMVVITDGTEGATVYDGTNCWHTEMYPDPKPPVDRTGAGDSFASTFTAAIILGKTVPEALAWGPINSMSVVQEIGAQRGLLSKEKLEEFLANAPQTYGAREI